MTDEEIIDYYAHLLIMQYQSQPKAVAHIKAMVDPVVMNQLPLAVRDAFNVSTAIGVQLDILGKYVGVTRVVMTFTGQVVLNDSEFRILVMIKLIQNNAGSSFSEITQLIFNFFGTNLKAFDYSNMHMDYFFSSSYASSNVAQAFVRQGLLPKPMGVELGALIYIPTITNVFGFRTYPNPSFYSVGFNTYGTYHMDRHFIRYSDALIF